MSALDLDLHPKQGLVFQSKATEILFGGAAGGGKSFLMRVLAIIWCSMIPGLQVYLFRRTYDDLVKNHVEGPSGFRALLAPWTLTYRARVLDDEIRFWNGSKIYLCHCEHEKHRFKYQGAEIHVLLIDELTTFTDLIYRFLRARVRMTSITLPDAFAGAFPRILAGSNPGNIGHGWVKTTFQIGLRAAMDIWRTPDEEGGMLRQFVPSRLEDNPTMERDDPLYRARLRGLGSPALVRAFELGDWDAVAGAFLEGVLDLDKHVVQPFYIPSTWKTWRALDWGFAAPYSVAWWALSHEGVYYRWRELYGWGGKDNIGTREDASAVARRMKQIEAEAGDARNGYEYRRNIADPAIFGNTGVINTVARMFRKEGIIWQPAKGGQGSRINGAQTVVQLLNEDKLKVFDTCKHWIRTVPALMPDPNYSEDVNTKMEDHAWDETRYALGAIRNTPAEDQEISGDPEAGTQTDAHGNYRIPVTT